ncbi:MAG: metal ABC transporter ATP-binding protein [Janthinobacterium sp.]|jgi:zinc transport system ATP-binding protein
MKSQNSVIKVSNLSIGYDGRQILRDISFEIAKGEIVGIIGPNGAGKTTLIMALLGPLKPSKGSIEVLGGRVEGCLLEIGYLPQRFTFDRTFPITVYEFLMLSLQADKKPGAIIEKLKEVDMSGYKNSLLGTLSGGQLQRILIARAILNDPQILILDEPATGIDIEAERNFYQMIEHLNHDHQITVIFISHEVDLVYDFAGQVICLNKTLVCRGVPHDILTPAKIKELYKVDLHHHHHGHHENEKGVVHPVDEDKMIKHTHKK